MKCPRCGSDELLEEDFQKTVNKEVLMMCTECGHSWWSYSSINKKA